MPRALRRIAIATAILALSAASFLAPTPGRATDATEVGSFRNDWTGNRIVVEAIADPKVRGITCHLAHFDRSILDRLSKGNWFEDPSNASIACRQTGPITVSAIDTSGSGEEVFSERTSLIFKSIAIRRIYDRDNDTLVYVAYSRQVKDASAKMSVSTVPIGLAGATWSNGKP